MFIAALLSYQWEASGQGREDYLKRENTRLRIENDSLRNVIRNYQNTSFSTWDVLSNIDWNDEDDELFGSSSVLKNSDGSHADLMRLIRKASPNVASYWNQSIDDQVAVYTGSRRRYLPTIFGRYEKWLPLFSRTFAKYGVPEELITLCIVESAVSKKAISPVGAAGVWQIMPATARQYGLRVDEQVDERFDIVKSTDAAARILRDIYKGFGRWDLSVLSYNCGAGRVRQAIIKAQGDPNVWEIAQYLPRETRLYLPAYLAARYTLNEKDALGIGVKKQAAQPRTSSVMLQQDAALSQVAKELCCSTSLLNELNPHILCDIVPAGITFYVPQLKFRK